jgi:hypothetical protein
MNQDGTFEAQQVRHGQELDQVLLFIGVASAGAARRIVPAVGTAGPVCGA